jgi:hypothetical protein
VADVKGSLVVVTVLASVLVAVAAASGAPAKLPAPLTLDGWSGVVPGMTSRQAAARWGIPLSAAAASSPCSASAIRTGALHGYALFEHGKLGAVFLDFGAFTPSGIRIGTSETALRRAFAGRLKREPHKYVRGGHYYFLTRRSSPHWQLRFDTNAKGRITQIGFGTHEAVSLVEGCS